MASGRIREKSTIGTRLSGMESRTEKLQAELRKNTTSSLEERVLELEAMVEKLTSVNMRLEGEYPFLDDRYITTMGKEVADWNTAVDNGYYWSFTAANGTVNAPTTSWVQGFVQRFGANTTERVTQTLRRVSGTSGYDGYEYTRWLDVPSGVWSEWALAPTLWASVAGKPSTYPPSGHTHPLSDVTGLSDGLSITNAPTTLANFNSAIATGFYTANGSTLGTPSSSTWYNVIVVNSGGRSTQVAYPIDRAGAVWKRWLTTSNGSTWSPWTKLYDERGNSTITAVGTGTHAAVASIGGESVTVTFPAGLFTATPRVFVTNSGDARIQNTVTAVSTTSTTIRCSNWTSTASSSGQFYWQAVQAL